MKDQFGREIDYMRISVTDRCNLRCSYCMPEGVELVHMKNILTYEEIREIAEAGAQLGITRLKITGGEPLVRRGCCSLVRSLKEIPGIEQVTMTTNGVLLERYMPELAAAGLDAVNISLDTLDRSRFAKITGRDDLETVLAGIRAAAASGIGVKINAVLQKDVNEDEWEDLARLAEENALDVRFIEMMPIGAGAMSRGVSNEELYEMIRERFPDAEEDPSVHGNGPAVYIRIPGWKGSIGFISAIHGKFCGTCNRIRLSAQGRLKPCLCYEETADLREILRLEEDPETRRVKLREALAQAIWQKPLQHCFENTEMITEKNRMVKIGG